MIRNIDPKMCKLCLSSERPLKKSHIFPSWAYKVISGPRDQKDINPNPYLIMNCKAIQTSWEVKDYMLCKGCEDLISEYENKMKNMIPISSHEKSIINFLEFQDMCKSEKIKVANLINFDKDCLIRFAISILWRNQFDKKPGAQTSILGPYSENFRKFLLKENSLTDKSLIFLAILNQSIKANFEKSGLFTFPICKKEQGFYLHKFLFFGLVFYIFIGGKIPNDYKKVCLYHGNQDFVFIYEDMIPDILNKIRCAISNMGTQR